MDKKKFGQVRYGLPYLPIQKVWTFSNESLLLNHMFSNFVKILVVNNQVKYNQGHLWANVQTSVVFFKAFLIQTFRNFRRI